ncbi:MAG TPA: hypothetical protein VLA41_07130 [Burkholderiales bacterium]|nr:hypothetical protein [Burkholderiales bacterium]
MTSPVDPNMVLMTGENSFIRLSADGGKTQSDRISHWRVLWCPAGAGHALFVQSTLTNGAVRIYADHEAVARWLQQTIESLLYPAFADRALPVTNAQFSRYGDIAGGAREEVVSSGSRIVLAWQDFLAPFVLNMPPGFNDRPIGVFSTFFPARTARVELDGRTAPGKPWPEQRGDREASSACLAWSETWVQPR